MPNDKPTQSKLLKLKEWVTVPEAARHLATIFDEEVTDADILRLALDGHLKLSVNLVNGAYVIRGKIVGRDDPRLYYEKENLIRNEKEIFMAGIPIDDERYIILDKEITFTAGVWDLPMIGAEKIEIENIYQGLTFGPEATWFTMAGAFVERPNGAICQLQERFNDEVKSLWVDKISEIENRLCVPNIISSEKAQLKNELEEYNKKQKIYLKNIKEKEKNFFHKGNFYPGWLPDDSVLVVRTKALMDLINSFSSDVTEEEPAPLTGLENRELGRLRQERDKWENAIKAAVHVTHKISGKIKRDELKDRVYQYNIPDTTIDIIWKALRDNGLTKGAGRPRSNK